MRYTILILLFFSLRLYGQTNVDARKDIVNMLENTTIAINVTNNDALGTGLESISITKQPSNGIAEVNDDFTIQYTPDYLFYGTDELEYKICDSSGKCDVALVAITVNDVNVVPSPKNDTVTVYHGIREYVDILANDENIIDEPISIRIVEDVKNGQANINSDNCIFAEFDRLFFGLDSCRYEIIDVDNDRSSAQVFFDVKPSGIATFFVPEVLSPNGDGLNDVFYIPEFDLMKQIKLEIYNSNGGKIYQDTDYKNDWEGISNVGLNKGKKVKPGTYYYFFNVSGLNGTINGFVYVSY